MAGSKKDPTKQTKGEKRRSEIISIARSVLIAEGYDAFVLREIAKRADMKLGNLQYYFATSDDLLEELARAENRRALETLREIENSEATPIEKIDQLVGRLLGDWQREGGKVFAVVTLLAIHDARFRRVYMDYYELFYTAIGSLLKSLEPNASEESIRRKARLATALLDGAPLQVPLRRGRGNKKERAEFTAEITDALLRILAHDT